MSKSEQESRTFLLEPTVVNALVSVGRGQKPPVYDEIRAMLPSGLSVPEVGDVGGQVSDAVELEKTSWDGISKGRRAEQSALLNVGHAAIFAGDFITVDSVVTYFRRQGGISGRLGAFMLGRRLNKAQTR